MLEHNRGVRDALYEAGRSRDAWHADLKERIEALNPSLDMVQLCSGVYAVRLRLPTGGVPTDVAFVFRVETAQALLNGERRDIVRVDGAFVSKDGFHTAHVRRSGADVREAIVEAAIGVV